MVRVITAALSFLLATGLYGVVAVILLVPTQGMKGNEGFLRVFLVCATAFLVANIGAGIGLLPLAAVYGFDAWTHGLLGFMVGSVLAALAVAVNLAAIGPAGPYPFPYGLFFLLVLLVSLLSPPIGGLLAFIALRRKQPRTGTGVCV
jgi:hypothetical protein